MQPATGRALDEVTVLASCAIKSALDELAPLFERRAGVRLNLPYDPSSVVSRKLASGAAFDVAIANVSTLDELAKSGLALADPHVTFASTVVAVGYRVGVERPDVSSHEALAAVVKRARAISYSDPALGGGSANFFARLIEDLGVGDALRAKAVLTMPGEAGYPVGDGRAEYGVAQASELALVSGIDCVPLFPDAPKSRSVYAVGVSEASPNVAAARAFVAFLTSYEAKSVLNSKWLNVT